MKPKQITQALALAALFVTTSALAQEYDFKDGQLYYAITDTEARTLPKSLTSINDYALSGNMNLTQLIGIENTQLTHVGTLVFNGLGIGSIRLPEGMTALQNYFLAGCKNLTEIDIPSSVTNIGWYAFEYN